VKRPPDVPREDAVPGTVPCPPREPGDGLAPEDTVFLDRMARWIAVRSLAVPAVVFLESSKPLSFVGSQFLYFFEPMVKIFVGGEGYSRFARLMEDRDNVERFLERIETAEQAVREERKKPREDKA